MSTKYFLLFLIGVSAQAKDLSLSRFLQIAWEKSPYLRAEKLKSEEREHMLSSARGKYFPHLSLQATDSVGFAAANRDLPVTGVMGSPYRSGLAGGIVVDQMIYDFGRIRSVMNQARAETAAATAKVQEEKLSFLAHIGRLYLECAQTFSAKRQNERLMTWARLNWQETVRMTKTGQRSLVDRSLVQMEVNDLHSKQEELTQQLQSLNEQLQGYGEIGKLTEERDSTTVVSCAPLSKVWDETLPTELKVEDPGILLRRSLVDLAAASADLAGSAQLPFLKASGSYGEMEKTRLVPKENYTAGLALVFPIWNGGEDAHREQAFKIQAAFHQENLKGLQRDLDLHFKSLRDTYRQRKVALSFVEKNLAQARQTMKLASQRYHQLSGPLIDVREAFKQLRSLEGERRQILLVLARTGLELNLVKE